MDVLAIVLECILWASLYACVIKAALGNNQYPKIVRTNDQTRD